jgi:hypothetical protein
VFVSYRLDKRITIVTMITTTINMSRALHYNEGVCDANNFFWDVCIVQASGVHDGKL